MPEKTRMLKMPNSTFIFLRQVAQYWLPALGTFYSTLAIIWGFPYGEQVVGTIVAVTTLLGVFLGISRKSYNDSDDKFDGSLSVDTDSLRKLEVDLPIEDIVAKDEVTLKIDKPLN